MHAEQHAAMKTSVGILQTGNKFIQPTTAPNIEDYSNEVAVLKIIVCNGKLVRILKNIK
jgi:hypothetical protein